MGKLLKILGMTLGALVLLVVLGVAGLYAWTGAAINKRTDTTTHPFTAPSDSASVARGEHFVKAIGKCGDCHGADYGGQVFIDDPAFGTVWAPNLTAGGIGKAYGDVDWERALRHGKAQDGRRLIIMPSNEYQFMSDKDLGIVVAYLRSVPAVERATPAPRVGPVARALYAGGILELLPADVITHENAPVPSVPVDSTVEYGDYLAKVGCSGCHGAGYGGGKIPGGPPDMPPTANLTPAGIGHYTYEQFAHVLRTGERPDGSRLHEMMPIAATKLMTDVEIAATFKYLRSLPAKPFGTR